MYVIDSSLIDESDVGDGDLAVPRDVPNHVEQHPVLTASLRINLQYLISDKQITCLCFAALCLCLSTNTVSCVWQLLGMLSTTLLA